MSLTHFINSLRCHPVTKASADAANAATTAAEPTKAAEGDI